MKRTQLAILPLAAIMVAAMAYFIRTHTGQHAEPEAVPDFSAIQSIPERKRRFFEFLLPKVQLANARVRKQRALLLTLRDKLEAGRKLTKREKIDLSHLRTSYRVDAAKSRASALDTLLRRVDTVPASLMLAQAATESAWGRSRFAQDGNNFFGIWCFTPGCGMTPKYRDEALSHEVARFDSVQASVNRYLHTINTNIAYRQLRAIRVRLRRQHKTVLGVTLAEGLRHYSERRDDYVRDIQQMIRINKLRRFTQAQSLEVSDNQ